MIYLFRKFNKQIIAVTAAHAWELFSSNGDWKHKPAYLGRVTETDLISIRDQVQDDVPIDEDLVDRANTGKDRKAARELKALVASRTKLESELMETLAAGADRLVKPENMDTLIINDEGIKGDFSTILNNRKPI